MILKLLDGHEIYVSKEQAFKIEEMITRDVQHIKLPDGTFVKSTYIASIIPGSDKIGVDKSRALEEGRRIATDEGIARARKALMDKLNRKGGKI